jgi:hypothetical protein
LPKLDWSWRLLKLLYATVSKTGGQGAYSYDEDSSEFNWDNSNTQYGLLGVWSGAEAGIEVPQSYWQAAESHWTKFQMNDGQWGYGNGPERAGFAMNCAGVASLFITHDYLTGPSALQTLGREPFSRSLALGLSWMERGDRSIDLDAGNVMWFAGYNLYGLERVGLASGFKFFGTHDWYRELAKRAVESQQADGSWEGLEPRAVGGVGRQFALGGNRGMDSPLLDTPYILLFLARGRHPILMNKLRFDGYWANRSRDIANLSRFAGKELERPLNWQVVSLKRSWTDWTDSPVLYLASHREVALTDEDCDKIRHFVESGGLLFTHADGGTPEFNQFALALSKKLFPNYEMQDLPRGHDIYSTMYSIDSRPPLKYVGNGVRILMLHSAQDIASAWELRAEKTRRTAFEMGVNIFVYATGKTDLHNRLQSPLVVVPAAAPTHSVPLGRLKYPGNWDPEPEAFPRMSRILQQQTGWSLEASPVALAEVRPKDFPIAHLTGTATYAASEVEVQSVRNYVQDGGVLFIDCAGGNGAFALSAITLMERAFPRERRQAISARHPLLRGNGECMEDLTRLVVRPYVTTKSGAVNTNIELLQSGKGSVIFTRLDVTSGLLGTRTWGLLGYSPAYSQGLLKNIVLWASDGQPKDLGPARK